MTKSVRRSIDSSYGACSWKPVASPCLPALLFVMRPSRCLDCHQPWPVRKPVPQMSGRAIMCAMDLSLTASYDATPEEVFAIITDVTFQEQVFERFSARSYDVTVGDAGDDMVLRMRWEKPPGDVASVARRFIGPTLVVAQTKIWHPADVDGAREAEVEGEVTGAPVKVTGRTFIVPDGRSTTQAFDLHVTASTPVPVVGKQLERVVADAVQARLEKKFELAGAWLSGSL
jgi:hypothetical protein